MSGSAFLRNAQIRRKLAMGYLPVANGVGSFREIDAPVFEFGILAAGNLYTTAEDLGRFVSFLFAEGRAAGGQQLLRSQTLAEMFTPQLTSDTNGFGLGFSIGRFRGRKTVNHMGAVYGFTSILTAMPSEKIGVVVLCNDDIAIGPVRRLNATALDLMLSARTGEAAAKSAPFSVSRDELRSFAGAYESQSCWAQIEAKGPELIANISGQKLALTPTGALKFEANGRVAYNAPFAFERDATGKITGFTGLEQKFHRIDPSAPPPAPESWKPFVGAYGPAFIPLIISVKFGHLYAMTENEFDYRLTPLNSSVFQMPPGMYEGEQIVFQPNRHGKVHRAVFANMPLRRR